MKTGKAVGGGLLIGLALGLGTAVIGPALWRLGRPLAKDAIKAGVTGFGAARVAVARASEEVEDLVAEAAHELAQATQAADAESEAGAILRG
ncbi:DUF5132 domain-containing protein [Aquabacter spiritensis]|uniref:Uncharacterized protein DUF5132 n=1 Tax=Aquabacter spiritensis TaxID=933073 RepID=A0A4R3M3M4_9HYPH|nr:DUF5132 domain-containing protein [Aquabacter spiritensis]TCT07800.1 uncharacterized protein DUF5132 [Aquabacter spiritensis]